MNGGDERLTLRRLTHTRGQEEKDDEKPVSVTEEAAQSNAFFLAIHGLLNSPRLSRRRRASSYGDCRSEWSSQTSISTVGDDDDDEDRWSCADGQPSSSSARAVSDAQPANANEEDAQFSRFTSL